MKNLFDHKFLGDSSYNKGWELALSNFQILEKEKQERKANSLKQEKAINDFVLTQNQNQAGL